VQCVPSAIFLVRLRQLAATDWLAHHRRVDDGLCLVRFASCLKNIISFNYSKKTGWIATLSIETLLFYNKKTVLFASLVFSLQEI
jgi:hypothetical protein